MAPLRLTLVTAFLLCLVIVMQVSSVEAIDDVVQAKCQEHPGGGRGVGREGCHNACQTRCRLVQDPYCIFTCVECCQEYLCVPSGLAGEPHKGECPCYEKEQRCP
ncbi:hypothetical protein Sjap_008744 [Stephania japonica]|uniref:Uncharacterized protein n=1 Tax=Stephania japonica TaxID=461633 RepID=A0AAP0JSE0_9MAGN